MQTNPLQGGPIVVVTGVGEAEGARGAAAALACAGADVDSPAVFIDIGGRLPRPALLATTAAQSLEERLNVHRPKLRAAARGQVCHVAIGEDAEEIDAVSAVVTVARGSTAVLHVPPALLQPAVGGELGVRPSGALLRADLGEDRPLVALAVSELIGSGLAVAVLKQRLNWVAERRAFFGSLPPGGAGGLPERLVRRLLGSAR